MSPFYVVKNILAWWWPSNGRDMLC